jgi:long-chain acyl-CoA synthetase
MSGAPTAVADTAAAWGSETEEAVIGGHVYRVYRRRRSHVADLLIDARRFGDREFLVQGSRRITFAGFAVAVRSAAARLHREGIGPGDRVMLLAANSIDWVVAFFAVLEAGGVVVLGNAWWSGPEVAHAASVAEPALVIADPKRAALVPSGTVVTELADVAASDLAAMKSLRSTAPGGEHAPAVILFTSGTTGASKGAVLSHRSVIGNIHNLLVATRRLPSELPADHRGTVSLVCIPMFHVGGMQVILTALLTGGTLVFLPGRFDAGEVLRVIAAERVRVWGAVPTMVSRVLDHPGLTAADTSSLASITIGGTYVLPELLARVRAAFPSAGARTGTMYGMTETGGAVTAVNGPDMEARPGTVGRPLPTVDLRISRPGGDGVGEIQARSPNTMDGYLGLPDDPVHAADGWINTGDLGRIDADGFLYVVGREKDLIIRGGENVPCSHVEGVLVTHPAVREVAVVGLTDPDFGECVAAAVVLRPGAPVTEAELRDYAAARLGHFQVPTRWWLRHKPLPANATGKILKTVLRESWPTDSVREDSSNV